MPGVPFFKGHKTMIISGYNEEYTMHVTQYKIYRPGQMNPGIIGNRYKFIRRPNTKGMIKSITVFATELVEAEKLIAHDNSVVATDFQLFTITK
jgi:hypothetical protein